MLLTYRNTDVICLLVEWLFGSNSVFKNYRFFLLSNLNTHFPPFLTENYGNLPVGMGAETLAVCLLLIKLVKEKSNQNFCPSSAVCLAWSSEGGVWY